MTVHQSQSAADIYLILFRTLHEFYTAVVHIRHRHDDVFLIVRSLRSIMKVRITGPCLFFFTRVFQPANLALHSFHRDRRSTAIVHVPLLPCHVILYSIMLKGNTRYCLCGASAVILSLSLSLRESALEQHLYNVVQFQQAGC